MEEDVFCKIISGKVPSRKIYEDERFMAFLDIAPLNPGHALVIPKKHYRWVWDLPENEYRDLWSVAKKVALGAEKGLGAGFVVSLVLGTDVPHAHIQIIPRFENDGHGGLINWKARRRYSDEKMDEYAEKIRQGIKQIG